MTRKLCEQESKGIIRFYVWGALGGKGELNYTRSARKQSTRKINKSTKTITTDHMIM